MTTDDYLARFPGADIYSEEMRASATEALNRPDVKMKKSASAKRAFSNPEVRSRLSASRKASWAGGGDRRKRASELMMRRMADPAEGTLLRQKAASASRKDSVVKKKSDALKGKNAGSSSWHWKGGVTPDAYWDRGGYEFKAVIAPKIRERDGNSCTACGITQDESLQRGWGLLCVHHEDEDSSNNADSNLRALCRSCHTSIHNQLRYG